MNSERSMQGAPIQTASVQVHLCHYSCAIWDSYSISISVSVWILVNIKRDNELSIAFGFSWDLILINRLIEAINTSSYFHVQLGTSRSRTGN